MAILWRGVVIGVEKALQFVVDALETLLQLACPAVVGGRGDMTLDLLDIIQRPRETKRAV
jgi:hypothetical protein